MYMYIYIYIQAPAAEWRPKILAPPAAAAFSTEGMGTVFHVSWSHLPAPKKVRPNTHTHTHTHTHTPHTTQHTHTGAD